MGDPFAPVTGIAEPWKAPSGDSLEALNRFTAPTTPAPKQEEGFNPVGAVMGFAGGVLDVVGKAASIAPFGWLPRGGDEKFREMGDWMKANDPVRYKEWELVKAQSDADLLWGGNTKVNFVRDSVTEYDKQTKEGLGLHAGLFASPSASLGGGLVDALMMLSLPQQHIERWMAEQGIWTSEKREQFDLTRLGQIEERQLLGLELNPVEQEVVDNLASGRWSEKHAVDYLVNAGQGFSRDFITQIVGSIITDPLLITQLFGAGALKVGSAGARVTEAGLATRTAAENLAVATYEVQRSAMAPAFKVARTIIDPFSLLGRNTATRGLVDLTAGASVKAAENSFGPAAYSAAARTARELNITPLLQSDMGAYAANTARTWTALQRQTTELLQRAGEQLMEITPDSIIDAQMRAAGSDAIVRLTSYMDKVKKLFITPEDDAQLAARLTASYGAPDEWAPRLAKMSDDEKSLWHALTYSRSFKTFREAVAKVDGYEGQIAGGNLDRLVILNDNILDNVGAQLFRQEFDAAGSVRSRYELWEQAARKWPEIRDLGVAEPNELSMKRLGDRLTELIDSGKLHTRLQPEAIAEDAQLAPIGEWLRTQNIDGRQVWNVGFLPDDLGLWNLMRSGDTGLLRASGTPFVSHVLDAAPAYLPVNDVLTNRLGQVIGPAAPAVGKGVEAVEVAFKVLRDQINGQRLLNNMERRFVQKAGRDYGISVTEARRMFAAGRDAARMQMTTIQGINPTNIWDDLYKAMPKELQSTVSKRAYMDMLMTASAGDMRIIGYTQGFTQRIRNLISGYLGYKDMNVPGRMTVTFYRDVRFSLNPIFYIQRITDGPYFAILKGIKPASAAEFKPGTREWEVERLLRAIGDTTSARDFAFDLPEYSLRSGFQQRLRARLGAAADPAKWENAASWGYRWQVNNEIRLITHNMGNIVREALEEEKALWLKMSQDETLDLGLRNAYLDAYNGAQDFARLRANYSQMYQRVMSDDEVGLKYMQEIFNDALSQEIGPDGLLRWKESIKTGLYHQPNSIGQLQSLGMEHLAADLGYITDEGFGDVSALMRDVGPGGTRSTGWLEETLREDFSAHPDYIKRVLNRVQFDWNEAWSTARVDMDLSPQEAELLQNIIGKEAYLRGMTPSDYMSQVLDTNLGRVGRNNHLGQLLKVVQASTVGDRAQQINALTDIFVRTLDPSGQAVIVANYLLDLPRLIRGAEALGTPEGLSEANRLRSSLARIRSHVESDLGPSARERGIAQNVDEYRLLYPDETATPVMPYEAASRYGPERQEHQFTFTESLGEDFFRLATQDQQDRIVRTISNIRAQFPDIPLRHVTVSDKVNKAIAEGGWEQWDNPIAFAFGMDTGDTTIVMRADALGPDAEAYWARRDAANRAWRTDAENTFRASDVGAPEFVSEGYIGALLHELGHYVDSYLRDPKFASDETMRMRAAYSDFIHEMYNVSENMPQRLSEYAAAYTSQEFAAEVFCLAFDPRVNISDWPVEWQPMIQDLQTGFRDALEEIGVWRRPESPPITSLDEPLQDDISAAFAQMMDGRMKGDEIANGDVEAIARHFSQWTQQAVGEAVSQRLSQSRTWIGELAKDLANSVPTDGAFAYNRTQGLTEQLLREKLNIGQRDAFRLSEMSTTRSVLDRTMNHPIFALYPSSYMWGKVFPELLKFVAKEPFGFETGALLYLMKKTEMDISTQREYDPKFRTLWDQAGGSETSFLLDYLTPSLPWSDLRVGMPPYLRVLAEEGFDVRAMLDAEARTISPVRWYELAVESGEEIGGLIESTAAGAVEQLLPKTEEAAPPPAPTSELESELTDSMKNLQDWLSR